MALSDSSYMIRDYDNIRKILRDIYIYGCFTKSDFVEMGFSGRKVDKEQQRIEAYLPDKFIKKRRVNKKVIQYCRYRLEDSTRNYLAETFRNKSFTMLDIMSFFFVLQILGDDKARTLPELLSEIPDVNAEVVFTKDNLRIKLDELVENKFIVAVKQGRTVKYHIAPDIWADFSDDELLDIDMFLEFIKNVEPLEMPYYFLQRKLRLYMTTERKMVFSENNPFLFKHNHIFNTLDNDVLLECLIAIQRKCKVTIIKDDEGPDLHGLPIKVIHDSTYGRQYLSFYNVDYDRINNIRLDRIREIVIGKPFTKRDQELLQENLDADQFSWCTSIESTPQEVIIHFLFDESKEHYVLGRLEKEGHGGSITRIEKDLYEFKIMLADPREIIPWVRSFGERARVISSGDYKIENTLAMDWEKAVNKYEALSRV